MKFSFHNHTYLCGHASGTVNEYVREAFDSGLQAIGMSDHIPLPDGRWPRVRMAMDELQGYVTSVENSRKKYPEIEVYLGAECEWFSQYREYYQFLLQELGFEYLIGAAHYIPMKDGTFPGFTKLSGRNHLFSYTKHVLEIIESGMFIYLAHPDIFHAGYRRWDSDARACSLEIIRCAKEYQVPLEINANGLRKPRILDRDGRYVPQYPVREFWELAAEESVDAVIGSDAHSPEDVISACDTCAQWLDELGLIEVQERIYRNIKKRHQHLRHQPAQFLHTENQ